MGFFAHLPKPKCIYSRGLVRRVRFAILLLWVPMTGPLGRRMVHFEFGQDRLAQPHPLQAFELG